MSKGKIFAVLTVWAFVLVLVPTLSMAVDNVKIGIMLPLSGGLAKLGESSKWADEFAVAEVNAEGGIKSLGGAKLELIIADTQGKPELGQTIAEQLIHRDKVDLILGCWNSAVTLPASAAAERYKVPFLVQSSVNMQITDRGFKYVFRSKQMADRDCSIQLDAIQAIGEKTGVKAKNFAIVYENSEWGQGNFELLKGMLAEKKWNMAFQESYAANAADLTPLIMKIKAAKPDVMMLTSYLADAILIAKTSQKQQLDLMGSINGGGGQGDPTYLPSAGDAADYDLTATEFDVGVFKSPGKAWAKPINDAFKAKYGEDFTMASVEAYANIWLIKDVLERAGSTDKEKIRDAFAKTNYTKGKAMLPIVSKIQFNEKGQNIYADELVLQAYKGKYHIIYPFDVADPDYKVAWPRPKWSERK
jgi:branched-chain amino acid transport system substrate-binding protein